MAFRDQNMQMNEEKKEKAVVGRGLINFVFSWSIKDVLNKDIYKHKVRIDTCIYRFMHVLIYI